MSNVALGANLLLGKGKVFFDRFDASGAKTGYRFLGDVSKLSIRPTDEIKKHYSSAEASAPLLASAVTRRELALNLTMHEFIRENLALALMGTELAFTQTSGTVTAESLGAVKKDRTYRTVARNISAVTVKKGATTLVAGTDYILENATTGAIYIVPTSATVVDGDTLTVDYTRAAIAAPGLEQVAIGLSTNVLGALLFIGDPSAGPAYDVELWRVRVSADSELDLIGEDYGAVSLTGEILTDSALHPASPLGLVTRKA